jgi:transcriptional regulator with XRE-family HTH domain
MKLDHEKVRWHRDRLGLTLDTLGEKAEVAKGTVLRAEHGEDVRPSSGRRIARALGVEISDLIPEKPGSIGELVGAGKAEAPPIGTIPNSLEELLEVRGARTRHLADENLKERYDRLPLEDVLQIAREVNAEIETIAPDLAQLGQQTQSHEAMRLYSEASKQILIARFSLAARREQKFIPVELEPEFDQVRQEFEKAELALAGVS